MSNNFERPMLRRNDRCLCGSGLKFKNCHGRHPGFHKKTIVPPVDTGETPIRWVIVDRFGTSFFSTKDNAVIVLPTREAAHAITAMDEFQDQEPGDINVAGVGPTKWAHLQSKLAFIEATDVEHAQQLVRERIAAASAAIAAEDAEAPPPESA